ncbi:MAG: hypothetical protein M3R01_08100, partial [Actinomycetota bacterium]|nr:hypothetical protein [Actinomycetota bacterium]
LGEDEAPVEVAMDPQTGAWRRLAPSGLGLRSNASLGWTGTELTVWGGAVYTGFGSDPYADGARYRPGR